MTNRFAAIAILVMSCTLVSAQESTNYIQTNPEVSYRLLEPSFDLRKTQILIEERKAGRLLDRGLHIGASLIAIGDYQSSSDDSKFAYLMRHPTSSNQIGSEVSELVIHSFQIGLTGTVNNWLAAHTEILYNPEQNFGTGTITSLGRNGLQLRKGYILVGDLKKKPIYFALGKMDTPFGQMGSVSPFTNTTMWHTFAGLAYGAQIGFQKSGLEIIGMAIQGGAQFRGANTLVGDSTNVPSMVNNFVGDINYTIDWGESSSFKLGGSYLHGSSYNSAFPVIHFNPGAIDNPAVTAYANLQLNEHLRVQGSYAETLEEWPGTFNPAPPLDVFEASKVSSMEAGARYMFRLDKEVPYALSAEFSNFVAGPDGAPWERQNQYVLGFCGLINNSSKLFIELFRTEGFSPLNFVSGSEPFAPFEPGTTHSKSDVITHGIVIGGQLTF